MEPPSLTWLPRYSVCVRSVWVENPLVPTAVRDVATAHDDPVEVGPPFQLISTLPAARNNAKEAHALEEPPDSAVDCPVDFPLGFLTLSEQLSVSFCKDTDQAHVELTESKAQFALRQPAILTVLMQFLPVATGTLKSASLVSSSWYSAAIHNINLVGRLLPICQPLFNHKDRWQERWVDTSIQGIRRYLSPQLVETLLLNRPAISAILARKRLPAFLRIFHFIDSWHNSDAKLRTLLFVLGSQAQSAGCLQAGIPLVLDSFLASSPRSAHMGFVWSTMESVLERDAQAILADLASRVARHASATSTGSDSEDEPMGMREMRAETEAMECGVVAGRQAPRHKLAVINRRLVLNVNAWCIRWISMMQHPKKTPDDPAKKPPVLSSAAIDLALYRIFNNLDDEKRAAWDMLLHQILKCTNKWLGIIRAMVRIMDSLLEHENLLLHVAGHPLIAPPEAVPVGHVDTTIVPVDPIAQAESDPPSESSANVD